MSDQFVNALEAGEAAYRKGDFEAAFAAFDMAMTMRASAPQLLRLYAECCRKTGRTAQEYTALHRLLVIEPAEKQAARRLVVLGAETGRKEADALARAALERRGRGKGKGIVARLFGGKPSGTVPESFRMSGAQAARFREARQALDGVRFNGAAEVLEALQAELPGNPAVLVALAEARLGQGDAKAALEAIETASESEPLGATGEGARVQALVGLEAFDAAQAALDGMAPELRAAAPVRVAEAALCHETDRHEEALALLERLEAAPEPPARAAELRARVLAGQGRFEEARPAFEAWAARAPLSGAPFITAADARVFAPGSELHSRAEALADNPEAAPGARSAAHFALAFACKGAGQPEAEFNHLETANILADVFYDPWAEQAAVDAQRAHVTAEVLARPEEPGRGAGLVFVCGLPRSGSTLAAQVLAAHPEAVSIGESQIFPPLADRAAKAGFPQQAAGMAPAFFADLAAAYLEALPPPARDAAYVIDKELAKYQHLGLLKLMFPAARIIHTRREPMDVCFSFFSHNFRGWPASFRQETLGHFHHLHDEVMAHWEAVMPDAIHHVDYEEMVADTEAQVRKLVEAAGMPFHPDCLDFQNAEAGVRTASAYQVRQKIYGSSVKAWERHAERLAPLRKALEAKPFTG